MTTMRDLVNRARSLASGTLGETINVLGQPYTPGDGRIVLKVPSPTVAAGMNLSADLNGFYVVNASESSGVLEVVPSPNGEPDSPLTAGTMIRVKPRFTDWMIFTYLNDQITLMSSPTAGLYTPVAWTDRVDPAWNTYQVPTQYVGMIDMMRVRHKVVGSPDQWTDLRQWSIQHQSEGGSVIRIFDKRIQYGDLEFTAKMPLTPGASLESDLVTDCLLSETMLDIPVLGATGMLLLGAEGQRLHLRAQGEGRRPGEVGVTANSSFGMSLLRRRDQRINDEAARLISRNAPVTGRW